MTVVAPHPGYGLRIYFRGTWRLCENDVVAIFQRHAFDNAVVEDDCGFVVKVADTFQTFWRLASTSLLLHTANVDLDTVHE